MRLNRMNALSSSCLMKDNTTVISIFHWLFFLSARETSSGNRSMYKSTRDRVDSKGLYGRRRLHLMGSWTVWWHKRRKGDYCLSNPLAGSVCAKNPELRAILIFIYWSLYTRKITSVSQTRWPEIVSRAVATPVLIMPRASIMSEGCAVVLKTGCHRWKDMHVSTKDHENPNLARRKTCISAWKHR